jgi:nucleotide-binding universal stress UspA family protein
MKILIGVDDSPHSNAALEFVRGMSWPEGSRAVVISAVRPAVLAYSDVYVPAVPPREDLMADMIRSHEEVAARARQRLQDSGLATEARVLQGDPREALVEAAKVEQADLLVVGSHGRTGVAKLLLGSVAAHVMAHAPCSVLVVKTPGGRGA